MRLAWVTVIAGCMVSASNASATDRTGYHAISVGDLALAERTLVAERRIFPDRPELMLNLAAVYERTGRLSEARTLLARAAAMSAIAVDLPDGRVASSRNLANAGLSRLGSTQMATR